jgi:hypothetical protein
MTSDGIGDVCFSTEPPTGGAHGPVVVWGVVPAVVVVVGARVVVVACVVAVAGADVVVGGSVVGAAACLLLDPHAATPVENTTATSTIDTGGTRRTASS